ncbi:hypothetical protein ANANG_G00319930, partial [Anguilla anguilla]
LKLNGHFKNGGERIPRKEGIKVNIKNAVNSLLWSGTEVCQFGSVPTGESDLMCSGVLRQGALFLK